MNTLEAISKRKSTRAYKTDGISEHDLQKILNAGFCAPVGSGKYKHGDKRGRGNENI